MQHLSQAVRRPSPAPRSVDPRWSALGLVQAAMQSLNLRDRDIAVLRGLLSFIPADRWEGKLVVFASNATLQARCDGIDERTLRRRLARLVEVGLIRRNQSPNRKRYVVRDAGGEALLTYGFDLAPLRDSLGQLQELAEAEAETRQRIIVLKAVLRDHLYHWSQQTPNDAEEIATFSRMLRRKASLTELSAAIDAVAARLEPARDPAPGIRVDTTLTDSDRQIDRHIQSSKKEYLERKPAANVDEKADFQTCTEAARKSVEFAEKTPGSWDDLERLAGQLAPAIGISAPQMAKSGQILGQRGTAMAILGLVEAFPRIQQPGRYFNTLLSRAMEGRLDIERMFRSLTGWARFPAGNRDLRAL